MWEAELEGVTAYSVALESEDGISRQTTAGSSPLSYPDAWEPLQGDGASYRLVVSARIGEAEVSSTEETPGFSLLEDGDELAARQARLEERPLEEPARSLLLAELYLSYGLRSEAVALLEAAPGVETTAAAQQLLGDTWWNMGLVEQAESAYTRARSLAAAGGYIEAEADALAGLGRTACANRDATGAQEHWLAAQALYAQAGATDAAGAITELLADAATSCH